VTTYTYSQAKQNFAEVLMQARKEGKVVIKRKDGSSFIIKSVPKVESPLNVQGLDLPITAGEIVKIVREIREK